MVRLHYFRLYSASGIYDLNPDADEELLSNDKVVVRLLGRNAYESVLDDFLISPGKSFDALDDGDKKSFCCAEIHIWHMVNLWTCLLGADLSLAKPPRWWDQSSYLIPLN